MNSSFAQFLITCAGWTLLHFIWQGLAVAVWLAACLRLLRPASANQRYLAGCAAMILMAAAPLLTFQHLAKQYEKPTPSPMASQVVKAPVPGSGSNDRIEAGPIVTVLSKASQSKPMLAVQIENTLPWLVIAWAMGVLLLSARLFVGWLQVRRLQRTAGEPLNGTWNERLTQLAKCLSVSRPVCLLESALVEVPTVAGWLRPVILLPTSCLAGLSPAQLEAVLAHELAHIRRHDYLVNLFQNLVETLLFYHPAVWWVSRCIRNERENCCDDLAVRACGDRVLYVRALATLEELRQSPGQLALAADGAPLLKRIRRLAKLSDREISRSSWPVALMLVFTMVVVLAICLRSNLAQANEKQPFAGAVGIVPTLPATNNVNRGPQIPWPSSMYTRIFYFDTNAFRLFMVQQKISRHHYTNENAVEIPEFLDLVGVDFDLTKPANVGKSFFYKDRKGMLMVHSTKEDLDKIGDSIDALNLGYETSGAMPSTYAQVPLWTASPVKIIYGPPMKLTATNHLLSAKATRPQVRIKTKFAVIKSKPGQADAFDGIFQHNGVQLQTNEPVNFLQTASARRTVTTNTFDGLQPPVTNSIVAQFTGIMTDPQFQAAVNDLEQRNGVELLNFPDITTVANRQAQVQMLEYQTIVTGLKLTTDYRGNVTNDFQTKDMKFGPAVDVIPKYNESGTNIDLSVRGVATEFLGYDHGGEIESKVEGRAVSRAMLPLPAFRLRELSTQATVKNGQTLVLGGIPAQLAVKSTDKTKVDNLVIFITPTLINADGSPYHPEPPSDKSFPPIQHSSN